MGYPTERLGKFQKGVEKLAAAMPDTMGALGGFSGAALKPGALTLREKELVAIGVAMLTRCDDCIVLHTTKALDAGCTRSEIMEAAGVAMLFGGGPVLGASASLLTECLDEFEKVRAGKR